MKNNRSKRAQLAAETLEILKSGHYESPHGKAVSIETAQKEAEAHTVLYPPFSYEEIGLPTAEETSNLNITVTNETTFSAVNRLIASGREDPFCLNFASAKNPGGGFLGGSQAQEEALSRASGLYPCLLAQNEYYDFNRQRSTCLYSDYAIYTPKVPVFRDDADVLLEEPYLVSMITSPAVNYGAVERNEPQNLEQVDSTMERRIRNLLKVAIQHQHRDLVLGAWGCGVFRNDPANIARLFREALEEEPFSSYFNEVVFAVLDHTKDQHIFKAFETQLCQHA